MATTHALYDAPAPRPPPSFPLPGERFASLAHFDLALSRAAYGHRYPLAPIQSSTLGTFTSRCPPPLARLSHRPDQPRSRPARPPPSVRLHLRRRRVLKRAERLAAGRRRPRFPHALVHASRPSRARPCGAHPGRRVPRRGGARGGAR